MRAVIKNIFTQSLAVDTSIIAHNIDTIFGRGYKMADFSQQIIFSLIEIES